MFSITPLGSCRIATPLKLAAPLYGYRTNRARSYGFSHSSAEVVQQVRFMLGEIEPPAHLWRFISRYTDIDSLLSTTHELSDVYVVEISSAKQITYDGWLIQLNYLVNQMHQFFSSRERGAEYWRLIDQSNQPEIDAFLQENFSATPDQIEDSEVLRKIRRSITTKQDLTRDVSYLIDKLPEVLFISHVNAVRLDGTPIPSREALINDVVDVVTQCGGRIYNPTHQMQKMTQEVAIEDYSDSLAHFTNEFSYVVVSDWFSLFLNDVFDEIAMQGDEALLDAKYVPHFEALLVNGALDGVEDRLLNIQAQQAGSAVLTEVLCKLYMSQNQLDKAFETAQAMRVSSGDSLELLWHYIDIAIEIGQFSHAADACKRLFDAEYDLTCERVKEFGLRAKAAQDDISALRFFDMALRLKPKNAEAAAELGQAILRAGDKSVWDALPEKLQIAVLSEFEANDLMGISKMVEFDFVEHLNLADMPADDLALYAANLAGEDRVSDAASMIAEWSRQKGGAAPSHADLRALVDEWFEKSVAAEDFETRMDLLDWVLLAQPMHAKARMAFRDIRRDVLKFAREMVAQSDRESLVGLAEQAKRLPFDLPELDLYLARLAFDKEDYEAAIAHGQSAAAHFNENVALWTMLMRSAFNLKDYIRADRFAAKVIETSDADTKRLEAEAEKRRDRMPILAYRAARQEEDVVKMIGLYAVAGRHDEYGEDAKRKRQTAETGIINQLRELQVQGSDEFVPFLQRVLQVMLTDPRVLISAGRYYVKQKDFATAQDYWRQLNEIDPSNEEISFQYNRCLERINEDQVA